MERHNARNAQCRARAALASLLALAAIVNAGPAGAQNLIANPGFENNPPPNNGNNIGWPFSPWILGPGDQTNVVKVDGPGGFDYGNSGPQSDASNNGAGAGAGVPQHYADIVGSNDFYQTFSVPTCGQAPGQTRTATYSGWFSTRDNLAGTGAVTLRAGAGTTGALLAQRSVSLPAPPGGSGTAPWTQITGTVSVQSGTQISYVVSMSNNVNFDEASLRFDDVTCVSAPLTLRKTWVNATVNDRAVVTASRGGSAADTLTSVADAANETDVDATPLTVFQGETIVIAETLPTTNAGTYTAALACTGGGTLSGNVLTVGDSGTPIACTYTNTAPSVADLAITKSDGVSSVASGATTAYTIVVTNKGPNAASGAVVRDPAAAGMVCTSASCGSATGGAVCPAVTVADLQSSAGVAIPTLPSAGSVTFTLTCTID